MLEVSSSNNGKNYFEYEVYTLCKTVLSLHEYDKWMNEFSPIELSLVKTISITKIKIW